MQPVIFARGLRRLVCAAGFAALTAPPLALSAAPAQAQFFGSGWASRFSWGPTYYEGDPNAGRSYYVRRGMPPRAVNRMLVNEGYRVLSQITLRGRVYLADVADGETGKRERLIIDAYSGDIVESYPLGRQFAPPGNITHVPRAEASEPRPAPQRNARLAPPSQQADPEVEPSLAPQLAKPKVPARAKAPVKPKPVIARRSPLETIKPVVPVTAAPLPAPVAAPVKPPLPSAAQPSDPLAIPKPAESAAPAALEPIIAAAPPAVPLPPVTPAPQPAAGLETSAPTADTPVQPLDDAAASSKPKAPVNDVPVAPLE